MIYKNCIRIVIVFALASMISSCEYVEGIYKDGSLIEKEVLIKTFEKIRIETPVDLILEQSYEEHARISGFDFKVEDLQFQVENFELIISSKTTAYTRKDQMPTVIIPVESLVSISVNAPSEISSSNELILDNLLLAINGRGTYTNSNLKIDCQRLSIAAYGENLGTHIATGQTKTLFLTMEGLANTEASGLLAQIVTINQRSLKSSNVSAADKLKVNMYSSGNVFFDGDPELDYRTFDPGWDVDFGQLIKN